VCSSDLIQKITKLIPIDGADAIETANVLGWELVVKKNEFQIGELCVYVEIDSILPEKPEFEFLRSRKFRIKTIKLKGQVSQGICFPLSILPKGNYVEGDDITEIIGVKKYDPQAEIEKRLMDEKLARTNNKIHKFLSKYAWYRNIFNKTSKGSFPSFIKKTDEDRIQLFPSICEREKDTEFVVTEKLDGQSGTYFLLRNKKRFLGFGKKYIFGVCSRNLLLTKPDNSSYWTIAKQYNIEKVLEKLIGDQDFVVLQGEILGTGIQKNKYKIDGYDFYAFNLIYPGMKIDTVRAMKVLHELDIKFVPILTTTFKLKDTIKENVEYAKGKSVLLDTLREGVVVRNYDKNSSFKIINPDFLLKNDE
jgi:RNA ligase (TIGR02306 family)